MQGRIYLKQGLPSGQGRETLKKAIFQGCATAIVTPFTSVTVDYDALQKLVDFQLDAGIDAIVVCGTTGEASTMNHVEQMRTIETVLKRVNGQIPVIAGTGSNNTATAVTLSREAEALGVDGLLIVTPYYNKATQRGLIKHYETIADATSTPIILYNVPSRTGVSCTAETYAALSAHPNIVGVKEASGNFSLIQKTRTLCPEDFYIWSGNDDETAPIMLLGGIGVISVVSNVAPLRMAALTRACLNGDFAEAGKLQLQVRELADVLFREVNPIPVKTALSMMDFCEENFRLPLCKMGDANREELHSVLSRYNLI